MCQAPALKKAWKRIQSKKGESREWQTYVVKDDQEPLAHAHRMINALGTVVRYRNIQEGPHILVILAPVDIEPNVSVENVAPAVVPPQLRQIVVAEEKLV